MPLHPVGFIMDFLRGGHCPFYDDPFAAVWAACAGIKAPGLTPESGRMAFAGSAGGLSLKRYQYERTGTPAPAMYSFSSLMV